MIRAVLDANVIVSAMTTSGGTLLELMSLWEDGHFVAVISPHILREVDRTWSNPYWRARISEQEREDLLWVIRRRSEMSSGGHAVTGVATHPEDDAVLATALGGRAELLVTGDRQLLKLGQFEHVRILDPRQFLDLLSAR